MILKLTKLQAEEVGHKIGVLCETPDLQEDYGITQEQAESLLASIPKGGEWSVPEWAVEAVKGELADHAVVLRSIARDARDNNEVGQALANHNLANTFDKFASQ